MNLVEEIYKLTSKFPSTEMYGLVSQMRRAAVSIPSNIAEGQKRKDLPEYIQFLRIANGSAAELETQVIIPKRIYQKLDYRNAESLIEEVQKMLTVLIKTLHEKHKDRTAKT